ncbi:class I SAM-dependent methyltransferase [bacterium]|nr:class I SAM-dependent methyltransferase [bacterium]
MTVNSNNPWLTIPAADYEGHMGSPQVGQLHFLSSVFQELLNEYHPKRLAVIGCATGNGFEHIDAKYVEQVIGIDIQPDYLRLLHERFAAQLPQLELICKDVLDCELTLNSLDFIFAGLLFEYVNPEAALLKFKKWLKPSGILATVLQLPSANIAFAHSSYRSIQRLEAVSHLVNSDELTVQASKIGLHLTASRIDTLPSGKQFFIGCYAASPHSMGGIQGG